MPQRPGVEQVGQHRRREHGVERKPQDRWQDRRFDVGRLDAGATPQGNHQGALHEQDRGRRPRVEAAADLAHHDQVDCEREPVAGAQQVANQSLAAKALHLTGQDPVDAQQVEHAGKRREDRQHLAPSQAFLTDDRRHDQGPGGDA